MKFIDETFWLQKHLNVHLPTINVCVTYIRSQTIELLKVECEDIADCAKKTSLPVDCSSGVCLRKHCYKHSDCPDGYGCDGASMCKRVGKAVCMQNLFSVWVHLNIYPTRWILC